jgi:hypothetical protein
MVLYWTTNTPTEIGEYLVETEGMSPINIKHRLLAFWNGKSWSFTGQTFVRRLNIPNIHNYAPVNISVDDIITKADEYVSDFINPIGDEEDHFIAGYKQALIDLGYYQ